MKHRLRVHRDQSGLWLYALLDTTKTPGNQIIAAGAGDAWGDVMRRGCAYLTASRAHQCCNVNRDRCWCAAGCDCQCEGCGCS